MSELTEAKRLFLRSNLAEAERVAEDILYADPEKFEAKALLGAIYARSKRHDLAAKILEPLISMRPDHFDSLYWLATAKKANGAFDEAVALCQRAIVVNPRVGAVHNMLGLCFLSKHRSDLALEAFHQAILLEPKSAAYHFNMGEAFSQRADSLGACEAFRRAVELDPNREESYLGLYDSLAFISAWQDALPALEQGFRHFPNSLPIMEALALCYCRNGGSEHGEALFRQISAIKPGYCSSYARWLQQQGRFDEAAKLLRQSIAINPDQGFALFGLADARLFDLEDGQTLLEQALRAQSNPKLSLKNRMYVAYALAKSYDHGKEFGAAMEQYHRANDFAFRIYNQGRNLDLRAMRESTDRLMCFFTSEFAASFQRRDLGSKSETPILIVGMIRSGTTLLDTILSSHPKVASAGEQPFWKLDAARITGSWMSAGFNPGDVVRLEQGYLGALKAAGGDAERITDKMPLNYSMLGLIHLVFPKAKILHIRRNPLDTCLSIYCTHFGGGANFAYKHENIVFHYREYLRQMEHWRSILSPECFFELDYEDLVSHAEHETRQIFEFCGLSWDEATLRRDQHVGGIYTPSVWQARQPIYESSVGKWRKYEPWLGQLLDVRELQHPARRPASSTGNQTKPPQV